MKTTVDIRCEWGPAGLAHLLPMSDVIIIVDVLSFSTCVDVAVARGAVVYPYPWKDATALSYAQSLGAMMADFERTGSGYSLSPTSLLTIPTGTRLVLPSPNGSTLSLATGHMPTLTGCLRNARAVAHAAQQTGQRISVIPAGERWPDGSLRPAIEDWLGAGAIIHYLRGTRSPEAMLAKRAWKQCEADVAVFLRESTSGRELIERGFPEDVEIAAALNKSDCVPRLQNKAYTRVAG